jgi:hypothetical protein
MVELKRNTTLLAAFCVIVFGGVLHLGVYYGRQRFDPLSDSEWTTELEAQQNSESSRLPVTAETNDATRTTFAEAAVTTPTGDIDSEQATALDVPVIDVESLLHEAAQGFRDASSGIPNEEPQSQDTNTLFVDKSNEMVAQEHEQRITDGGTHESDAMSSEEHQHEENTVADSGESQHDGPLQSEDHRPEENTISDSGDGQPGGPSQSEELDGPSETEEERKYREWYEAMMTREEQLHALAREKLNEENATVGHHVEVPSEYWTDGHVGPAGSKLLILSAWDNNLDPHISAMALKNRDEYAAYHGYIHYFYNFTHLEKASNFEHPVWLKLPAIQDAFARFPHVEWIWWLDADAIIMNPYVSLAQSFLNPYVLERRLTYGHPVSTGQATDFNQPQFYNGTIFPERGEINVKDIDFVFSQDELGINAGSFFVRRSNWTDTFIDLWGEPLLMWNEGHNDRRFERREQDAFVHLYLNHQDVRRHVGLIPQRYFNAYSGGGASGFTQYYDGDLLVHFAGMGTQSYFKKTWKQFWLQRNRVPDQFRNPDDSDINYLVVPEEVEEAERLERERLEAIQAEDRLVEAAFDTLKSLNIMSDEAVEALKLNLTLPHNRTTDNSLGEVQPEVLSDIVDYLHGQPPATNEQLGDVDNQQLQEAIDTLKYLNLDSTEQPSEDQQVSSGDP